MKNFGAETKRPEQRILLHHPQQLGFLRCGLCLLASRLAERRTSIRWESSFRVRCQLFECNTAIPDARSNVNYKFVNKNHLRMLIIKCCIEIAKIIFHVQINAW